MSTFCFNQPFPSVLLLVKVGKADVPSSMMAFPLLHWIRAISYVLKKLVFLSKLLLS